MKKKSSLYPLKFTPILKEKIWGGNKLDQILNKNCGNHIGESWEISGVKNNISIISNGFYKGKSLEWLIENFSENLLGLDVFQKYGNVFPLLFKFIDARENLSIQVHPDDALAKSKHNSFGKTEMWYVLNSDSKAELIVGFKKKTSAEEFLKALSEKKIADLLNHESVERGDAFIIKPGTVHAIGAGVLLAEIQQTSDITYRIYDWDRLDNNGELRELHTDSALEIINFSSSKSKLDYVQQMNIPVRVGETDFFEVNKISLSRNFSRNLDFSDSFKVYMCISGEAIIENNDFAETIKNGETILIPAQLKKLKFKTSGASFLEVFIP